MVMSKRARLEATFAGAEVDRPSVALWRHWPIDDLNGGELAHATLTFQKNFDFDFVKVTPNSNYCVAGYGAQTTWHGNEEGTYVWGKRVIQQPEDWVALRPLDPDAGLQGEVLQANRLIAADLAGGSGEDVPFITTIFNPLSQAKNLAGDRLLSDLRLHPEAVKAGLATIQTSILRFVERLKTTGAAGIFLAVQHASYDLLSEAEYAEFCRPLDLEILQATEGMWFNLVHLHGHNVMFDMVADYPAQVINWHDQETPPTLVEAMSRTGMALCGGLRQLETMMRGNPAQVQAEAAQAMAATANRRFILGTGCVTPIVAPTGNLLAARRAVSTLV